MRMKQALLGGVALIGATLSLVGAAAAQDFQGYGHEPGYQRGFERGDNGVRRDDVDARLERTAQWIRSLSERRALDPGQTRRAWESYRGIRQQAQYLRERDGGWLDGGSRRQINARLDRLTGFLRWASQNQHGW